MFARAIVIVAIYVVAFWVLLPLVLVAAASSLDGLLGKSLTPNPVGYGITLLGAFLLSSSIALLWRDGKGLPVSALPPPKLARRGPYQYVRHPIYLGAILLVVGMSLAFGSFAGVFVLSPAFIVVVVVYTVVEERGLVRRFGDVYRRYRVRVGMLLPHVPLLSLASLCTRALYPISRSGTLPEGPAVVVANHSCYLDPFFLLAGARRPLVFLTTAEVFRPRLLGALLRHVGMIPVRRYRADPGSLRHLVAALDVGETVVVFVEGERSWTGAYTGCPEKVARVLARTNTNVVAAGISGAYDAGPRFSGTLRRRKIAVRFGNPLALRDLPAREVAKVVDESIRSLIDHEQQRALSVDERVQTTLPKVIWACPSCGDVERFDASASLCANCHSPVLVVVNNRTTSLDLAAECSRQTAHNDVVQHRLRTRASRFDEERDDDERGREGRVDVIRPLHSRGEVEVALSGNGLDIGGERFAFAQIVSVTTERADTLQLTLRCRTPSMMQLRFTSTSDSPWRWQRAIQAGILLRDET